MSSGKPTGFAEGIVSEVDEIEARLRGPVNCWLNNNQQSDFARLIVLARSGEHRRVCSVCGEGTELCCSDCRMNFATAVHVCKKSSCREAHELKCFGSGEVKESPTPPVMRSG